MEGEFWEGVGRSGGGMGKRRIGELGKRRIGEWGDEGWRWWGIFYQSCVTVLCGSILTMMRT